MQRKKTFLVVCFSILTSSLWAQNAPPGVLKNGRLDPRIPSKTVSLLLPPAALPLVSSAQASRPPSTLPASTIAMPSIGAPMIATPPIAAPGSSYYLSHLGIFCKEELKIENTLRIPVRLRLGSLQEVNRLEGKPGW
jgi:hypothetical protein